MPLRAKVSSQQLSWREWSAFASTWERLYTSNPQASFFLSREWVDTWLATFGESLNPDLITFSADGEVVGCCLIVWRTQWVRGALLRRVFLNCSGEDTADSTCIEYNTILSLPEYADQVTRELGRVLRSKYWDELNLNGVAADSPLSSLAASLGKCEISAQPSHLVDLSQVRDSVGGYDSVLSPNTRKQLRRGMRQYEQTSGPCTLRLAATLDEAMQIFARLIDLHQKAWQARGRPGVFASGKFTGFHTRMIESQFAPGQILMAEVCSGSEVIGALYGFFHRGRVYLYQSGFLYAADSRLKPGLITHYLAILHCLKDPLLREYDLLAGDSQFKRSLETGSRPLQWIVVRRMTLSSLLFVGFRWVKRTYVQLFEKSSRGHQQPGGVEPAADAPLQDPEV
jgi:CelD/BcsL family acetyltransferase involved in cellulose biosynthesis